MTSNIKGENQSLPVSGKGYTWKIAKTQKSQKSPSITSDQHHGQGLGVSGEDWVDFSIQSNVGGPKEHQRHHSTEMKTVSTNIQKSPLDKKFFMRKIKLSKMINQEKPSDLKIIA